MSHFHVGTIGWSYNFWKGTFYPQKLPSKQFLTYYADHFNSVEVDATFYRIPNEKTVLNWTKQTPQDFVFSLKFPQIITHVKMLRNCQPETKVFLERTALLEDKLGVLLLQLPPAFGNQKLSALNDFLCNLPKSHRYAVEVRNKNLLHDGFYSVLRDNEVALAWVDSPFMPLIDLHLSNFVYIRWEGDRKKVKGTLGKIEVERKNEIQSWAEKIKPLSKNTDVFGYFSKYYSGYPPFDVTYLQSILDAE
jgi:uncharacterized protein YecE (DUF72 family)